MISSYRCFYHVFHHNGWKRSECDNDYNAYSMNIVVEYNCTCYARIAENDSQLSSNGHYGVAWIDVSYENEPPYGDGELGEMLKAIELAEDNLLLIGIPFCPDYKFHGRNKANKKRRNTALRRKLNLADSERAAGYGDRGTKIGSETEDNK